MWHDDANPFTLADMNRYQRTNTPGNSNPTSNPTTRIAAPVTHGIVRNYLARSLIQEQQTMLQQCYDHLTRRTRNHQLVYTGTTALKLCYLETPWCPRLRDFTFQVMYDNRRQRPSRHDTGYIVWHDTAIRQKDFSDIQFVVNNTPIICTHPLVTWAALSRHLSQVEVIVQADAIVRATACPMHITTNDITTFLNRTGEFAGKNRCRAALPFLSTITDSPMEARAVLALMKEGMPRPRTQWKIYIPELNWMATVDMAYPEQRVIIEYDGDAHRVDKKQYRWDERKRQALRSMGYTVIVVFADDVLTADGRNHFALRVGKALHVEVSGQPIPEYRALLNDERDAANRERQRTMRQRKRLKRAQTAQRQDASRN